MAKRTRRARSPLRQGSMPGLREEAIARRNLRIGQDAVRNMRTWQLDTESRTVRLPELILQYLTGKEPWQRRQADDCLRLHYLAVVERNKVWCLAVANNVLDKIIGLQDPRLQAHYTEDEEGPVGEFDHLVTKRPPWRAGLKALEGAEAGQLSIEGRMHRVVFVPVDHFFTRQQWQAFDAHRREAEKPPAWS